MKVCELKDKLDMYIHLGHGADDIVISCKEPSVGHKASEPVKTIGTGTEWDKGSLFIVPEHPLLHYDLDRDTPQHAVRIVPKNNYSGKVKHVLHCPRCSTKLNKSMNYCPECGQKLDMQNIQEIIM